MNRKNRIIAIGLILVMCMSILPMSALADGGDTCIVTVPCGLATVSQTVYVNGILTMPDNDGCVGAAHYTVPAGSRVTVVFTPNMGYTIIGEDTVTIESISENMSVSIPDTIREGHSFGFADNILNLFRLLKTGLLELVRSLFSKI